MSIPLIDYLDQLRKEYRLGELELRGPGIRVTIGYEEFRSRTLYAEERLEDILRDANRQQIVRDNAERALSRLRGDATDDAR